MKKTKIVCTIGPKTESVESLKTLLKTGMNMMRLNFSHGDYEEHGNRIINFRQAQKETGIRAALLLDTKGPEIRTIKLEGGKDVTIVAGQEFTITTDKTVIGNNTKVAVTYEGFARDLKVGNTILIDDGLLAFTVTEINGNEVKCIAQNGGELGENKGVNLPNVAVNLPALAEKDINDLKFGCEQGIDYVAASFIRKADDVRAVRRVLDENGGQRIGIISKIENQEGLDNFEEILALSDGIMVARGDLGVEIPVEDVPVAQKMMIKRCNEVGKVVITATQMLDSMIKNPRPTRAEVNDVANAILDGTDCVMLSGESAKGKYPVEAVKMMNQIAISTEVHLSTKIKDYRSKYINRGISAAVAYSAVQTAHNVNAKCILASSMSGFTTRIVSKFKPDAQIIGLSPDDAIVRQMQIYWGVRPFKSHKAETTKDLLDEATDIVLDAGLAEKDDILVLTGGGPANHRGKGVTNMLKVVKIGEFGE